MTPTESLTHILATPEYQKLVGAIADGALSLVGAGTSIPLGYPSWNALLKHLGDAAATLKSGDAKVASAHDVSDVLVRADIYTEAIGLSQRAAIIRELYGKPPKRILDIHRDLLRVPFRHYLTTNYDPVLEFAHKEVTGEKALHFDLDELAPRTEFANDLVKNGTPRNFVHLHGSATRAENIVLGLRDYDQLYKRDKAAETILKTILAFRPLVFVGFSGTDDHFMRLMDEWRALLQSASPRHFALLPSPGANREASDKLQLETRYSITPIFFDPTENYAALGLVLARLAIDTERAYKRIQTRQIRPYVAAVIKELITDGNITLTGAEALSRIEEITTRVVGLPIESIGAEPAAGGETTPLDQEIDHAHTFIHLGQPSVALALFDQMLVREGGSLSGRLLYRLHANRGNALYSMGRRHDAAKAYLDARTHFESKDSRALEVLAYVLLRESAKALPKAEKLCRDFPDFPRAHALRLQSMPKTTPLVDAIGSVPRPMRREAEVASALAGMAADHGELRVQVGYRRAVVRAAPDWAEGWVSLGTALFMRERKVARIGVGTGMIARNAGRLRESKDALDKALGLLKGEVSPDFRATALFNRASVRRALGDENGAADDLLGAYALAPERPEIVSRIAWLREQQGNVPGALQLLNSWQGPDNPSLAFMRGMILFERKQGDDLAVATGVLEPWLLRLAELDESPNAVELFRLLAEVYVAQGKKDQAVRLYEHGDPRYIPEGIRIANLVRLTIEQNDAGAVARAHEEIKQAADSIAASGDWFEVREVAFAAADVQAYGTAAILLTKILESAVWVSDSETLIRWAYRAGDYALLLRFCRELREHGIFEKTAVSAEIDSLLHFDEPDLPLQLMRQWLEKFPDDKRMRMNLSAVAIQRGNATLIETDPANLPSVDELTAPEEGATLLGVLRESKHPEATLTAAYDLWRRFPDSPLTQQLLISTVFNPGKRSVGIKGSMVVDTQTAVTLRMLDDNSHQVLVVERGKDPRPSLNEFPPEHHSIRSLLGKAVGDEVNISDRRAVLEKIEHKVLYRVGAFLASFNQSFPEEQGLKRFHVPDIDKVGTDPKAALGPMWDVLKAEEERRNYVVGLYRQGMIPIALAATALGKTVLDAMNSMAIHQHIGIHVADIATKDWLHVESVVKNATAVVLDNSAIATMLLLDADRKIGLLPFKCVVPETAVQELRDILRENQSGGEERGYIAAQGDRFVFSEYSAAQMVAWNKRLENLINNLTTHCEIVGGSIRLEIPNPTRDQLISQVGAAVVDALAIAAKRDLPLWTDDIYIANMLGPQLRQRRVWTQPVVEGSTKAFTQDEITDASVKLALWGYNFTKLSVHAIVMALKAQHWDADTEISRRLLQYVADVGGLSRMNCRVTQLLLIAIWKRAPRRIARVIIPRILNLLPKSIAGPLIARPLYRGTRSHPDWKNNPQWRQFCRLLRNWRMHG